MLGASVPSPLPVVPWHCRQFFSYNRCPALTDAAVAGTGFLTAAAFGSPPRRCASTDVASHATAQARIATLITLISPQEESGIGNQGWARNQPCALAQA